jgi:serine/threonine protein kinase
MTQAIAISSRPAGRLGTRVCGFQIVERIAEGDGAVVYRASDDKRDVAVKIYERGSQQAMDKPGERPARSTAAGGTELDKPGERPARSTAAGGAELINPRALVESAAQGLVQHPAVARLIDATLLADGAYCLVSDWIHGVPLTAVIAEAPSWERVRRIVESINAGLGAIHAAGVIHRDLSPDNILAPRAQAPAAVIIDFSNALVQDGVRAPSSAGHGATAYAAPEQTAGLPLDGRADLYALGVVLYELLTGSLPDDELTPPRARAPEREIPVVAEELCMWLLAKDRDARVPSSRVLAVTLGAVAAEHTNGGGQP